MHERRFVGERIVVSAYILEIRSVTLSHRGHVGYGIDDLGREFEVALDPTLAAEISSALDRGRRPIVAVERGRSKAHPARALRSIG